MAEIPTSPDRREKLEALRELGVDVYPTRFDRTHTISQALAEFSPRSGESAG